MATPVEVPAYLLWVVVGGAGMFGGFLFGIKDKKLSLPRRSSKYVIEPGFIGDCLFGLAGGFLVFILLPGNFEFSFDRAICNIHLKAAVEVVKKDLDQVLRLGPENGIWVRRPHVEKGRAIITWIQQNADRLQDWIREHDIQLPEAREGG